MAQTDRNGDVANPDIPPAGQSAIDAAASATTATTQAGIATTQASIATTQAGIATTQAGIATTQAGIATTKAAEAAASAAEAAAAAATSPDLRSFTAVANTPANAVTITIPAGPIQFRSATLGSGTPEARVVVSPISMVVSDGSTLGAFSGSTSRIAVLAIDNAGTVEVAVVNTSGGLALDEAGLISTTAEGGAGGADSVSTVYSTTARTNVAYRVIGYYDELQATAGTHVSALTLVKGSDGAESGFVGAPPRSMVRLNTANGYGAPDVCIRRFSTVVTNQGTDITYSDTISSGSQFIINTAGIYAINYSDCFSTAATIGISLNTSAPASAITAIPASAVLAEMIATNTTNSIAHCSWVGFLRAGDIIRPHTVGVAVGGTANAVQFTISRIA